MNLKIGNFSFISIIQNLKPGFVKAAKFQKVFSLSFYTVVLHIFITKDFARSVSDGSFDMIYHVSMIYFLIHK